MNIPLDALQSWMQSALIFPHQTSVVATKEIVESSPRLTAEQRLGIYQRSYYLRILKCMEEQFPALRHALGGDLFRDFARQYLEARPPERYTLYDLGRRFPAWFEEMRPDRQETENNRETWIDFMVDLARFERQLFTMFDAPGDEGQQFADEATPDSQLRLQRCFALGDYRFPVGRYYHGVREGNDPQFPPLERSYVAVVRKDYLTRTFPLTALHHIFLTALQRGKSVEAACGLVARQSARPVEGIHNSWTKAGGLRQRWIESGFFVVAG